MSTPIRIERRRTLAYRLQDQSPDGRPVVAVTRPHRWGNPFRTELYGSLAVPFYTRWLAGQAPTPPGWRHPRPALDELITALRGKHLACFCPTGADCHADVLLGLANTPLHELQQDYQIAHAYETAHPADEAASIVRARASAAWLAAQTIDAA